MEITVLTAMPRYSTNANEDTTHVCEEFCIGGELAHLCPDRSRQ